MHPLVGDLTNVKTNEIEQKINDLTKKYFMTYNTEVKNQIAQVLDVYREEQQLRQRAEFERMLQQRNKDLDNLIKIN